MPLLSVAAFKVHFTSLSRYWSPSTVSREQPSPFQVLLFVLRVLVALCSACASVHLKLSMFYVYLCVHVDICRMCADFQAHVYYVYIVCVCVRVCVVTGVPAISNVLVSARVNTRAYTEYCFSESDAEANPFSANCASPLPLC